MKLSHALLLLSLYSMTGLTGPAFALSSADIRASMTPKEKRIDELRDQEIAQLEKLVSRQGDKENQPDYLLRLAEVYTEKYKLYFFKENEVWSKKMDEHLALPPEQAKYRKKPVIDDTASRSWLVKAVKVLQAIPLQKIQYSKLDEVYYFLAFNQWELGNKAEAVKSFEKILEKHQGSKFTSEANRYIADFAFAARDFDKARKYYERAAKAGDAPTRPRVLYGLAWSHFKQQNYKAAVNAMKEAIQLGRAASPEAARQGLALQRDAAESLALFYSEGGNVEEAGAFFIDLFGETEGPLVLRKLSDFYQRQGKYAKALAVNKQLLSLGGTAARQGEEQRFEIMVASLNMAATKGDATRRAALLKAMTAEFVTNSKEPDEERFEILKTQVRKAATLAHREGNKSQNAKASHERAADLYRLYLTAYGPKLKSEDTAEIHWYLADVLNQLGRHREATAEYKFIVDSAKNDKAYAKYEKDAAAAMVYALNNQFKSKGDAKKMPKGEADQLISALDSFVATYPEDKQVTEYKARAAGILVASGRMEEARPRLHDIVDKHPRSKEAWDAAGTLIKDAEARKDSQGAKVLAETFLANEALLERDSKDVFRKSLQSVLDRSIFKQTQEIEKNDPTSAAKKFEETAAKAKDPEVKAKALNNAAVLYGKLGDHDNELRIYESILKARPGNDQAERAFLGVANEHFLSGRYSEAADVYERFYRAYKPQLSKVKAATQKDALEALRSAALLRRALRQGEKASENFRDLVDAANKGLGSAREAAGEFLFDVAKRLRDEGNSTEAVRSFQKYSTAFPDGPHAVAAQLETALLYVKLKEEEKAQSYFRTAISKAKRAGKPSGEELSAAARARLELLGPLEETFEKAPLRLPEAQLKKDINSKLQALERLSKGYVEVVDFGDGQWGVEAYRRMALAYRSFGRKLESAPIPEKASPEDKAKFKAGFKGLANNIAYPKVAEFLDFAVNIGEKIQVVGPTMARVYVLAALQTARPDRLPLIQAPDFSRPQEWLMGDMSDDNLEKHRTMLRKNSTDLGAWTAIGNYHLLKGEEGLAEIFYLHAVSKNAKYVPALNNLAYLRGRSGDVQRAMLGFKHALSIDEFALAAKKNAARLQMGAGLWRHAAQNYRQLEVRAPNDKEVKRGIALAALATGKTAQAEAASSLLNDLDGENGDFADACLALAKGNREKAGSIFSDLSEKNEFAKLIVENWSAKEGQ